MDFGLATPQEVAEELGRRARRVRLELDLTQQTLADRAGVSRSLIRRLEDGRPVGLHALLSTLMALGRLEEMSALLRPTPPGSLGEIINPHPPRQRGTR